MHCITDNLTIHSAYWCGREMQTAIAAEAQHKTALFSELGVMLHAALATRNVHGHNRLHSLLQFGLPINVLDDNRNTPLHHAVLVGFPAGVQILIEHNADILMHNGDGIGALQLCTRALKLKKRGKHLEGVALKDLRAYFKMLDSADNREFHQNNLCVLGWAMRLRVNDRVEVHGMEDGVLHNAMNGTVCILQYYQPGPNPDEPEDGTWRLTFTDDQDRGPVFVHASVLRRICNTFPAEVSATNP